jgi:uncharacterized protein
MIEVRELNNKEIEELIARLDYGHLACCDGGQPYVVPIHYAYNNGYIYVYTTQGKKSEILSKNPRICLQIEDVKGNSDWTSVIIYGEAQELTDESERAEATDAVVRINPTLTPAVSIHWMDNWVRENIEVVFRIVPLETTGREGVAKSETHAAFVPARNPDGSVL